MTIEQGLILLLISLCISLPISFLVISGLQFIFNLFSKPKTHKNKKILIQTVCFLYQKGYSYNEIAGFFNSNNGNRTSSEIKRIVKTAKKDKEQWDEFLVIMGNSMFDLDK